MKKMLDELKKLDVEYKAPVNFKDKVMNRIKTIDKEDNNSRKTIHYNKYVITWVASAAVILLAFVVTIKNGRIDSTKNGSAFDSVVTGSQMDEDVVDIEESEEIILERSIDGVRSEYAVNDIEESKVAEAPASVTNSIQEDAVFNYYGDSYTNERAAKNLMSAATESTNESIELYDDFAFKMADIEAENEVYNLLIENNIKIVEEEQDYIIVEISLEKAKEILKEHIDEIKFEEINETKIKIEF